MEQHIAEENFAGKEEAIMKLLPYRKKDAQAIAGWVKEEREHAMWCANLFPFPLNALNIQEALLQYENEKDHIYFVAADDNGEVIGFFFMVLHHDKKCAYMGFVIIDGAKRGNGYGKQMMELAFRYAFTLAEMEAVRLRVYDVNDSAHQMYLAAGMQEIDYNPQFFRYQGETWGTYRMQITKEEFCRRYEMAERE